MFVERTADRANHERLEETNEPPHSRATVNGEEHKTFSICMCLFGVQLSSTPSSPNSFVCCSQRQKSSLLMWTCCSGELHTANFLTRTARSTISVALIVVALHSTPLFVFALRSQRVPAVCVICAWMKSCGDDVEKVWARAYVCMCVFECAHCSPACGAPFQAIPFFFHC